MKLPKISLFLAAGTLPFAASLALADVHFFEQDFSSDHDGINERNFDGHSSNLFLTPSGGGMVGAPSQSAGQHLEVGLISSDDFSTAFGHGASWGDNAGAGTFVSGLSTSFDVYIDNPNAQADFGGGPENLYEPGDGWFFHPTLLNPAGDTAISGGGFGVQMDGDRNWLIAATGNALGGFEYGLHHSAHPQSDDAAVVNLVDPLEDVFTASEGWLTFETMWVENTDGGIDQINTISLNGTSVFLATINDAVSDVADAGTIGTAWLGQDGPQDPGETGYSGNLVPESLMGELAIDNVSVVPEPSTYAAIFGLIAAGAVFLRRRNRK